MKIVNILTILLLAISCKSVNNLDSLYGQWPLANFYYKEKCLSCDFKTYNIYFDKSSGWLTLDNYTDSLQYKGKFEFIKNKKNELTLKISNSDLSYMNGVYNVKIDTLFESPQRDEISVIFQSDKVYMKGYKNIVKKIGN